MKKYYGDDEPVNIEQKVESYYSPGQMVKRILTSINKTSDNLKPEDLIPVEHFHLRGPEGTKELLEMLRLQSSSHVLDVGCGIGGTCRLIATRFKSKVTGIDLTEDFVETARELTGYVGLDEFISYQKASATSLPFENDQFDIAISQHINMNIAEKGKYIKEVSRVLKPGGKFGIYEIFQNEDKLLIFPVPWADNEEISYLTSWEKYSEMLVSSGLKKQEERDVTRTSSEWLKNLLDMAARGELRQQFVFNEFLPVSFENLYNNIQANKLKVIQAVYVK